MAVHILDKIVAQKWQEVETARNRRPQSALHDDGMRIADRRPFLLKLSKPGPGGVNIIAEIKRASPSKGPIRPDLDPAAYAVKYETGGAAALSVLTDKPFFQGSIEDLQRARSASKLPVLRKDFIISSYQIYESAAIGADAVLLIASILSHQQLQDYLSLCRELRLDALVEVHTEAEFSKASQSGAGLIGVNNRNLSTFQTDINTSIELASRLIENQVGVSESAIRSPEDIRAIRKAGIFNFLIGESLVRAADPIKLLHVLQGHESENKRVLPE